VPVSHTNTSTQNGKHATYLSAGFMGEGSAEDVMLLLWLLWREPLCEEEDLDPERRKGCEKNSSNVKRSTGLRRSSPCSREMQALDSDLRMGSGTCASCLSIALSKPTWLAPLNGGFPAESARKIQDTFLIVTG